MACVSLRALQAEQRWTLLSWISEPLWRLKDAPVLSQLVLLWPCPPPPSSPPFLQPPPLPFLLPPLLFLLPPLLLMALLFLLTPPLLLTALSLLMTVLSQTSMSLPLLVPLLLPTSLRWKP
jgi:hypothetical protein